MASNSNKNNSNDGSISEEAKAKLAAALGSQTGSSKGPGKGSSSDSDAGDTFAGVLRVIDLATGLEEEITREANIHDDLNIDSLSMLDIAVRLEDKFGVRVEESDIHSAETVGDLVDLIDQRLSDKS